MRPIRHATPPIVLALLLGSGCGGGDNDLTDPDGGAPGDTESDSGTGDADSDGDGDSDSDADAGEDTEVARWAERVDEFWGDAPDEATRLEVFDALWGELAASYACFDAVDIDWDTAREHYRPLVEEATSYGRFVQLMNEMVGGLVDSHSILDSFKVCFENPTFDRPPRARPLHNFPRIGGCVTLDDEDNLLVYRVAATNPLELEVGDVIVGLDGKSWQENLDDAARWKIPFCEDWGSTALSVRHNKACALPNNPHLFETVEIEKAATGEVESYSLEEVTATNPSYEACSDQLPVPGVPYPWDDWQLFDDTLCGNCLAYGVIDGTDIGYINVFAWYGAALDDFQAAVEELYDTTEGLIVDQRFNLGGIKPFIQYGFPVLFGESVDPLITFNNRDDPDDYTSFDEYDVMAIVADPETYYDHPIAVLTGPKAGSAGDMCPYTLAHHPRARSFGRPTNGAFGETTPMWNPDPYLFDLIAKASIGQAFSADGEHLQGWIQQPDEEVWLTRDDVIAGVDTVLEAALEWIAAENE